MKPLFVTLTCTLLLSACSETVFTESISNEIPIVKARPIQKSKASKTALQTSLPKLTGSQSIAFDDLPRLIRQHNPELAAARLLVTEAHGRLRQAGLATNPNLEIGFEADRKFHDLMLTVGFSRAFPRTSKIVSQQKASALLIDAAQAEVRDAERLLLGQARLAYIKALTLQQKKSLISDQQANSQDSADFLEAAALKGEASLLDAGIALLEATRLENEAKQTDIQSTLATESLKPLLGIKPTAKLTLSDSLPQTDLPPLLVAATNRPDLQAARLRAKSASSDIQHELSKKEDDLEAGVYAGIGRTEDAPGGLDGEQIFGLNFKIPLPYYNDNSGSILAAQARQKRLDLQAQSIERTINAQAHASYAEMKQWKALAEKITASLLPLADKQISQTKESHARGETSLREVLHAQEQKLSLQKAHLDALQSFHLARAKYLTDTNQ